MSTARQSWGENRRNTGRLAMAKAISWWTVFVTVLLSLCAAQANDAAVGGRGIDLAPVTETRIVMRAEDIYVKQRSGAEFEVRATYTFENPTSDEVSIQMGFPERRCGPDSISDCNGDGSFSEMNTTVQGEPVPHRVAEVGARSEWSSELGRMFLFDVSFDAGETVTVEHRYVYTGTHGIDGVFVEYVTKTGALWGGPIDDAKFTFEFNSPVCSLRMPAEVEAGLVETIRTSTSTTYVLRFTDWTPTFDIELDAVVQSLHLCIHLEYPACPWPEPGGADATEIMSTREGRSRAARTIARNTAVSDEDLRLCRNLPYAMVGHPFRSEDLRERFYGVSRGNDAWLGVMLRMSPSSGSFTSLPPVLQQYVAIIHEAEQLRAR